MKPQAELAKPLPSNIEAERAVLGAVILDNSALLVARTLLEPADFFLDQHRRIFISMMALEESGQAIDLTLLTEGTARSGDLEAVGGAPYLAALADGMPRVTNVEHYARIVKEKALLRNLIHATDNIQQRAFEGEDGAATILENARQGIAALIQTQPHEGFLPMKIIVRDNFEALEKIFREGRNVTGLATGYSQLDHATAGLQPGELIILAARPSHGKSSLALNVAENVAVRNGKPVGFCSLEMSKESLLQRLLASVAQIDAHKFRTGHLSREDWRRLTEALGTLACAPLWIDDSSSSTVSEIAARAERLKQDHGLALLIVDYLQLVGSPRHGRSRQEEVSEVSRNLKALSKDLGAPVLALSQLTRAPDREERAPMLSDLRESGAIEQDADVVLFIHRPGMYDRNATPEEREASEIIIAKQRNGPTDIIRFVFRSRLTRFEEAAPESFTFPPDGSEGVL
jgi:replicative DNA helicase